MITAEKEIQQFSAKLARNTWVLTVQRGQGAEEERFESADAFLRFLHEALAEPKDDGSRAWG